MRAVPLNDEGVLDAMNRYRKKYGKPFPLGWVDVDFFTGEDAVRTIEGFISRGTPVTAEEVIDTKLIFGEEIDLKEFL